MKTNPTQTDKATPIPWRIGDFPLDVVAGEYQVICRCEDRRSIKPDSADANAALIVRAVNEHDALNVVAEAAKIVLEPYTNDEIAEYWQLSDLQDALKALSALRKG